MATSRVACNSFNIGTNATISITRDKSSYTHTVTFAFGSYTGTIATKTTQTSIVWSPSATEMYKQIPSAVSRDGTITCQTYDGNTLIGTSIAKFYAYAVKSDCLPTVSVAIEDTNASTIALTGNKLKLIRYLSKPKVVATATAKNSATIKSGQIYNPGGLLETSLSYTFDTVYGSEWRCTATDSRGYSTTTSKTMEFVEYDPCHFTTPPAIERTESTSTTATLTIKGYCFKGSFGSVSNTLALKYRYKITEGSYGSYVTISGATWNADGTFTATANVPNLALKEQYTFEVIAQDKLTSFGDDEEILLVQGIGDLRIAKDYVMSKNNFITGDKDNEEWRCFKARRKRDGINYDANFGAGYGGGGITATIEVNQVVNGEETKIARYDLRKDSYLYNYFTNMSVAEIMSYAPSIVAGGQQGNLLLNGGNAQPILIQWGRVSITPTGANVVTKMPIVFDDVYQGIPAVYTELSTSAPSTMDISAGDITATGFNIYLQRTNTTATSIMWFAVGNGTNALPE